MNTAVNRTAIIIILFTLVIQTVLAYAEPGSKSKVKKASSASESNIVDLVEKKKIEIEVSGEGIQSVSVKIRKLVSYPVNVHIPVGTFFVSSNSSSQDMVTTGKLTVTLIGTSWKTVTVQAACANRPKHIPSTEDTFTAQRSPNQEELVRLIPALQKARVDFKIRQAAIWIITDDADYDDLGILVTSSGGYGGVRAIGPRETAQAMKICAEVGINIKSKAIWRDRSRILEELTDRSLKKWLSEKIKTSDKIILFPKASLGASSRKELFTTPSLAATQPAEQMSLEQRVKLSDAPYKAKGYLIANIITIKEGQEDAIIGRQDNGNYFKATVQGWNDLDPNDLNSIPQAVKDDLNSKIERPLMWLVNKEALKDKDYDKHYQALLNNARLALFGKIPGTVIVTLSNPKIQEREMLDDNGKIVPARLALYNLFDASVLDAIVGMPTEQASLAKIAMDDKNADIRNAAVARLTDQALLAKIAVEGKDADVRSIAMGRLTDQALLVSTMRQYITRNPESPYAVKLQKAIADMEGRDIVDLLAEKKIEVTTGGSGIENVRVKVQRLVPIPVTVRIPIGTYFVSKNSSSQNMVTTAETKRILSNNDWIELSSPAACTNRSRDIPGAKDSFIVQRGPQQSDLAQLVPLLDKAKVAFGIRQAAVWIVTDNASYKDLGILVSRSSWQAFGGGTRVIQESEVTRAMMICEEAGIDITQKAIWNDRQLILKGLKDSELKTWLEQKF